MQVITIICWIIKLVKTLCFCTSSLEINQWNLHCFIPVIRISDAENVSIWWRHHVFLHEDVFCENKISMSLPNHFHNRLLWDHVAKWLGSTIRHKQKKIRITDTRFSHLFLNYYQKRGSVMAITWRVLDEATLVPWTKTRSRIECACSCANWSNCARIWFSSAERICAICI